VQDGEQIEDKLEEALALGMCTPRPKRLESAAEILLHGGVAEAARAVGDERKARSR
jgi:hypothetical protein